MTRRRQNSGFTIVELIVVIVIIAILASIVIVSYGSWRKQTSAAQLKNDLNGVASAMENARNFSNAYPSTVPSTFMPSTGTILTPGTSSGGTAYCITATMTSQPSLSFYINNTMSSSGPQSGACS